jgi:peptidoglycan/LPS O-acetylase OafA/YrhL
MTHTPHDEPRASAPAARRALNIVVVAALSTLAAFAIAAAQDRQLGDEPLAMIGVGCVFAGGASSMRVGRPLFVGLAAMAGFPVAALVDMVRNGGHNLFPLEFALYAVYGGLGVFVALIVGVRRK